MKTIKYVTAIMATALLSSGAVAQYSLSPAQQKQSNAAGLGAADHTFECPTGSVISAMDVAHGWHPSGRDIRYINGVGFYCSELNSDGSLSAETHQSAFDGNPVWYGNNRASVSSVSCAGDAAFSGLKGKSGSYVDRLGASCASVSQAIRGNSGDSFPEYAGGDGGAEFRSDCGAGYVATGAKIGSTSQDRYINHLSLTCQKIARDDTQWTLKMVDASSVIRNLAMAEQLLDNRTPTAVTNIEQINFSDNGRTAGLFAGDVRFAGQPSDGNTFAVEIDGSFNVLNAGEYTFGLRSDDGVRLSIDGNVIAQYTGITAPRNILGSTYLEEGYHSFKVTYFENAGGSELELSAAPNKHTQLNATDFTLLKKGTDLYQTVNTGSGFEINNDNQLSLFLTSPQTSFNMQRICPTGQVLAHIKRWGPSSENNATTKAWNFQCRKLDSQTATVDLSINASTLPAMYFLPRYDRYNWSIATCNRETDLITGIVGEYRALSNASFNVSTMGIECTGLQSGQSYEKQWRSGNSNVDVYRLTCPAAHYVTGIYLDAPVVAMRPNGTVDESLSLEDRLYGVRNIKIDCQPIEQHPIHRVSHHSSQPSGKSCLQAFENGQGINDFVCTDTAEDGNHQDTLDIHELETVELFARTLSVTDKPSIGEQCQNLSEITTRNTDSQYLVCVDNNIDDDQNLNHQDRRFLTSLDVSSSDFDLSTRDFTAQGKEKIGAYFANWYEKLENKTGKMNAKKAPKAIKNYWSNQGDLAGDPFELAAAPATVVDANNKGLDNMAYSVEVGSYTNGKFKPTTNTAEIDAIAWKTNGAKEIATYSVKVNGKSGTRIASKDIPNFNNMFGSTFKRKPSMGLTATHVRYTDGNGIEVITTKSGFLESMGFTPVTEGGIRLNEADMKLWNDNLSLVTTSDTAPIALAEFQQKGKPYGVIDAGLSRADLVERLKEVQYNGRAIGTDIIADAESWDASKINDDAWFDNIKTDIADGKIPAATRSAFSEAADARASTVLDALDSVAGCGGTRRLLAVPCEDWVPNIPDSAKIGDAVAFSIANEGSEAGDRVAQRLEGMGVTFDKANAENAVSQVLENTETSPLLREQMKDAGAVASDFKGVAFKWAGRAFIIVGVASSGYHIYSAPDKAEAVSEEIGAWTGAIGGAELGAMLGSSAGPVGTVVGGLVGGAIGGFTGSKFGRWLEHQIVKHKFAPTCANDGICGRYRPPM